METMSETGNSASMSVATEDVLEMFAHEADDASVTRKRSAGSDLDVGQISCLGCRPNSHKKHTCGTGLKKMKGDKSEKQENKDPMDYELLTFFRAIPSQSLKQNSATRAFHCKHLR